METAATLKKLMDGEFDFPCLKPTSLAPLSFVYISILLRILHSFFARATCGWGGSGESCLFGWSDR
jgi:hypothetical protein